MSSHLPAVLLEGRKVSRIGFLFMETESHVVLLSALAEHAYLGPVRPMVADWLEPEAQIVIVPRDQILQIKVLAP